MIRELGSTTQDHSCCDEHVGDQSHDCCNPGHPVAREQASALIARELGS